MARGALAAVSVRFVSPRGPAGIDCARASAMGFNEVRNDVAFHCIRQNRSAKFSSRLSLCEKPAVGRMSCL
jgi:hypothetical protein